MNLTKQLHELTDQEFVLLIASHSKGTAKDAEIPGGRLCWATGFADPGPSPRTIGARSTGRSSCCLGLMGRGCVQKKCNGDKSRAGVICVRLRISFFFFSEPSREISFFFITQQPTHRGQHRRASLPTSFVVKTIHDKLMIACGKRAFTVSLFAFSFLTIVPIAVDTM